MTEQELRDNYARAIGARGDAGRGGCIAPDAIVALVQRNGPEATRLATLTVTIATMKIQESGSRISNPRIRATGTPFIGAPQRARRRPR